LKEGSLETVALAPSEAPSVSPTGPAPTHAAAKGMPPWVLGSLAVAGIVIIFLLILLFSRTSPPPAPPVAAPPVASPAPTPPPAVPAPAPAAPAADLKEELQGVLSTLRDAQMKKNITQFMGVYSNTLPNYDQKRKDALEAWQNFDYATLVFTVDKVQAIDPNNALAWVTWYMDIHNRNTQELASATQTYQARFVKEMGNWRIRELKEVQ
jgi:hypothetical protein